MEREENEQGWQPMETAPKNGSFVWAWNPHQPEVMRRLRWGRRLNGRLKTEDWVTHKGCVTSYEPTHWLPAPPVPSEGRS